MNVRDRSLLIVIDRYCSRVSRTTLCFF